MHNCIVPTESTKTVKEAPAAPPSTLVPLTPDKAIIARKAPSSLYKGASVIKASNLGRAAGMVQKHMHWTFMQLGHTFSARAFWCSLH
jgi:hypothetical protein